ncbi:TPM domain-containing protein [Testudinibacter sp. TR-2022]|uniref:TPM domain-containing protein n=1 Tax=Testudinibacter sp. TR-2022 TaxID=2585029 RepID=UPI001119EDA6|nr:TPM domain-containing protein [Testudinibacter sp. TR-2022]TNH04655.1 TPM domain-containing protein [Pasteurellaceae bacterium Phil31]TNH07771.1 TPM domain-containing protein [Testudinibacter sp. TR-2022]TNH09129.1 TPM domain-containing protein [Testudinibacter sp. TR-2022]TNH15566.1 TPM domain-containing protein [Testudinibacter sp. TR-2022]TNH17063.1 TPM domain-containing protein [Testudinibacter sp. TR-2022]
MPLFAKSAIDSNLVESAIQQLELQTSAEVRVYIEKNAKLKALTQRADPIVARAEQLFNQLEMQKTAMNNGVLIYVALKQRQCAVIGDSGIHQYVSNDFWQRCCDVITAQAAQGNLTKGIIAALYLLAEKLSLHFPRQADDIDELPNEVIIR